MEWFEVKAEVYDYSGFMNERKEGIDRDEWNKGDECWKGKAEDDICKLVML